MAEPISIQQLKDASEDAISLAEFINKPENVMIPRRLASDIHSLQYYLEYMKSFAQRSYETYDEMVANAPNLPNGVSAFVTNDLDTAKNGIYTYNGTSFVKGEYQPENAAKDYVESKLDELPFEGGVLADTFVTVTANGTGSVTRTLRDVVSETVTPADFGAIGDGTLHTVQEWITSERFASLAAIKAVYPNVNALTYSIDLAATEAALLHSKQVTIDRHYVFNNPLFIASADRKLSFTGKGKIESTSKLSVIVVRADGVTIEKPNVLGCGIAQESILLGHGIHIEGASNCLVSGGLLKNFSYNGVFISPLKLSSGVAKNGGSNTVEGVTVDCSMSVGAGRYYDAAGIMVGYSDTFGTNTDNSNNSIVGNTVIGVGKISHGIAIHTHGKNNAVEGNTTIDTMEYGIVSYCHPYGAIKLTGSRVVNNNVSNVGLTTGNTSVKGMGIYMLGSHDSIVSNNTVDNVLLGANGTDLLARGAIAVSGSSNVVVTANIVKKSKMYGIQIAQSEGCTVTANKVNDTLLDGFRSTNSREVTVSGNSFIKVGGRGMFVACGALAGDLLPVLGFGGEKIKLTDNHVECVNYGIEIHALAPITTLPRDMVIQGNHIISDGICLLADTITTSLINNNIFRSTTNNLSRIQLTKSSNMVIQGNYLRSTMGNLGFLNIKDDTGSVISGNNLSDLKTTAGYNYNGTDFLEETKRFSSKIPPVLGVYAVGDIVWNTNPSASKPFVGWICTTASPSGTGVVWQEFGGFYTATP